jgi:NitT/TauT family transport system ATP-binding protein
MTPIDDAIDIQISGLYKEFGEGDGRRAALRDLSLEVKAGELAVVVGPSGCGKTTLLRIVAGLESATRGTVWRHPTRTIGQTTYVHQFPRLLAWRTMFQNAAIGIEMARPIGPGHLDHIQELIDRFGLSGFEGHYPAQLSGGMQQRLALIRAIACRPRLMLCDEPFSSIDFVNRLALSVTFKRQCKVDGITTVVVTHNIDEAIFLGDVIYVLSARPGSVKRVHRPVFSGGRTDAVECRRAPEFGVLFTQIWKDLET